MITAFRSVLLLSRAILVCACIITPTLVTAANYYLHKGIGNNNNSGTQPDDAWGDLKYAMVTIAQRCEPVDKSWQPKSWQLKAVG